MKLTAPSASFIVRQWHIGLVPAMIAAALGLGGCATSGPQHVYIAPSMQIGLADWEVGAPELSEVEGSDYVSAGVVGLAYDYNTDYLFVRIAPGNIVLAFNRPAKKIYRTYNLPSHYNVPGARSLDLTIRPSDRHLFMVVAGTGRIAELKLNAEEVRSFQPAGFEHREIGGLAYDDKRDRLLVLFTAPNKVVGFDRQGRAQHMVEFPAEGSPTALAYNQDRDQYYAPAHDGKGFVGFGSDGKVTERISTPLPVKSLAGGQRSALRLF